LSEKVHFIIVGTPWKLCDITLRNMKSILIISGELRN